MNNEICRIRDLSRLHHYAGPVTKQSSVPRGSKKPAEVIEPVARRRRPREETRELLLQEAEDLLVERLAQGSDSLNPLAALRITEVLASINARLEGEPSMTTGAAYQIWESQTAFQDELLDRIMRKVAVPWEARTREAIGTAMEAGLPLTGVVAAMSGESLQPRESVELSLACRHSSPPSGSGGRSERPTQSMCECSGGCSRSSSPMRVDGYGPA